MLDAQGRLDSSSGFLTRLRLLGELRARIGFDAYAFLLTDPQTTVG
jgi:hypothetical protein